MKRSEAIKLLMPKTVSKFEIICHESFEINNGMGA